MVDGVFNIVAAVRGAARHERWVPFLFQGILGVAIGVITVIWPGLTALALLYWIAFWAILTGFLAVFAAIRLRREMRGEWLLALAGVLSIAFGVLLVVAPGAGALAVLAWIAAYALLFGIVLIALGLRLRAWTRRHLPESGAPRPIPV
jgi:uncharacterized membrane protein HdeD (DUF308 family)